MSATSTGDPVWEAAVDGAQRTLSVFETRLRSEDDATVVYGLRVVVDGRLLWLDAVMRRPPGFAGIVDTDSDGPARGAVIVVGREAVVDWIIADAVGIHGGYTLRVERDRLPEAEQRTFDAELGAPLLPLP